MRLPYRFTVPLDVFEKFNKYRMLDTCVDAKETESDEQFCEIFYQERSLSSSESMWVFNVYNGVFDKSMFQKDRLTKNTFLALATLDIILFEFTALFYVLA